MSAASAALQDVATTPPIGLRRATALALVCLVGVVIAWMLLAQLDIVVTAPGRLVPDSQVKTVQAAEAGVVSEIRVREGSVVAAGDVLIRLDTTLARTESRQLDDDIALRRLTLRAIDAALGGHSLHALPGDPPLLLAQVQAQFVARRRALHDALDHEREATERAQAELLAAERMRDKLQATLPNYAQAAASFERLGREGFIGELAVNDKRRELIEKQQDLAAQHAAVRALVAALAQARQRSAQLRSNFAAELQRERTEALAQLQRLTQERERSGFRSGQLDIRAPQAGVIKELQVVTPGAVLASGATLMSIVPRDDGLRAEVIVANEDVGFIAPGQPVKLKLAAYPFHKYGMVDGRVLQLSADAVEPATSGKTLGDPWRPAPLAYRMLVDIERERFAVAGKNGLPLAAGMAVSAEIHQGRRTVMEYLLSPMARLTEAGREQ